MIFSSINDVERYLILIPDEERKKLLQTLSTAHLSQIIGLLSAERNAPPHELLIPLIQSCLCDQQLEVIGKSLSIHQFLSLLNYYTSLDKDTETTFSRLLVGFPQALFGESLNHLSQNQIKYLSKLSSTEPIQHHIHYFIHSCETHLEQLCVHIADIQNTLGSALLNPQILNEAKNIEGQIRHTSQKYHELKHALDKCLILLWKTDRSDLIDRASKIKESFDQLLVGTMGHPETINHPSSGLFQMLEQALDSIYSSPQNEDPLSDTDPAIDGLTKLSIWYMEDYIELGIIPEDVKNDVLSNNQNGETLFDRYDAMCRIAQAKLKSIGLVSVADLKRAKIYSKQTLVDYLNTHRAVLQGE